MNDTEFLTNVEQAFTAFDKTFLRDFSFRTYPWETAELIEIYEDYFEMSESTSIKYEIVGIINKYLSEIGEDWRARNDFFDDIAWIIIAVLRAHKISGREDYLNLAKKNFDRLWELSWDVTRKEKGAYFSISRRCKTACSNLPLSIAASMLAKLFESEDYADKAKQAFAFVLDNLYEQNTGRVLDAVNYRADDDPQTPEYDIPQIDDSRLTYSHGTFIFAAQLIYERTNDPKYLRLAEKTASYVMNDWFKGGIMDIEYDNRDLVGFKGIFARYLGRFAREYNHPEYMDWLRKNAISAWEHRNKYSLMDTRLGTQTDDDINSGNGGRVGAFNFSSALSVMIQAVWQKGG